MFTSPFPDHPAEILSKKSKNKSYLSCYVWERGNSHPVRFPASRRVRKYVYFPIPRSSGRDLVEEIKKQIIRQRSCRRNQKTKVISLAMSGNGEIRIPLD